MAWMIGVGKSVFVDAVRIVRQLILKLKDICKVARLLELFIGALIGWEPRVVEPAIADRRRNNDTVFAEDRVASGELGRNRL